MHFAAPTLTSVTDSGDKRSVNTCIAPASIASSGLLEKK